MVNDIKLVDLNNGIVKYADDITIVSVRRSSDTVLAEVKNLESWAANNRMSLNLSKTWEMLLHNGTTKPAPLPMRDLYTDSLLSRAASRLYILRVCKYCGYTKDQLSKLSKLCMD